MTEFKLVLEGFSVSPDEVIKKVTETLSSYDEEKLTAWGAEVLPMIQLQIVETLKERGMEHFSLSAWAGIQGAGKGTNIEALTNASKEFHESYEGKMPESLDRLVNAYSGKMEAVITGTGGMFVPGESGEYRELFGNLGDKINELYPKKGLLVPDELTGSLVGLMVLKRICEGADSVQIDLYPRTSEQLDDTIHLLEMIEAEGIKTDIQLLDLRLIGKDEIADLSGLKNRKAYAERSAEIGSYIKDWTKQMGDRFIKADSEDQMAQITEMLTDMGELLVHDQVTENLTVEIRRAMDRVGTRGKKENRGDDQVLPTVLNRIRSYELSTAPSFLVTNGVRTVSAFQKPEEVIKDIILSMVGMEYAEDPSTIKFIEIAQAKALEKVNS